MLDGLPLEVAIVIIRNECAANGHYTMDDVASGLMARVWLNDLEFEDERHFRNWVRKFIRVHFKFLARRQRLQKNFSEMIGDSIPPGGEVDWLDTILTPTSPNQEIIYDARLIRRACHGFPFVHRRLVMILAEGASIIEAAKELGLDGYSVLRLLQEVRQFLITGNSVQPIADDRLPRAMVLDRKAA